ncbi:hypothetical protein [Glycomyces arizonensis]|uniref:hypothetical protein n=1 Tax=Glycomyces arizonensis TaxID=256035 RepID=UPI0003FC55E2|nr:hypothetical protein [Glycomyces arizonensis]
MDLSDIDPGPDKPGTVTAAQVALWLQVVYFFCGGIAPAVFWWPAFAVVLLDAVSPSYADWQFWLLLLCIPVAAAYTSALNRRINDADRRARIAALVSTALLAAGTVAAVLVSYAPSATFITTAPFLGLQAVTLACLCSPEANAWFRYRVEDQLAEEP